MKLLMVNDEVLTVETMKTDICWKQYGIEAVWTAYDAEGGKECILQHEVDIMLCDIEMPGENGIELLRWVRHNKKDIECIFLTCHASFEYAKEAIGLDCRDYILIPATYEAIGNAVLKVVNRIHEKRREKQYQEYGKSAVREKLDQAIENCGEKKTTGQLADEAACYIMQNLGSETLSVNEVAEKLYLHPVYLNRIFRKERDSSVGQFIISQRMHLAGELLRSSHLSANAVAEMVGYRRYNNFNLMFHKHYGCSPSQYAERAQGNEERE